MFGRQALTSCRRSTVECARKQSLISLSLDISQLARAALRCISAVASNKLHSGASCSCPSPEVPAMRRVLLCLWFFAILLTFSTLTLAQTNLVGSSTLQSGHDNNSPGEAEAFKATASNSGTVTSCSFYVDTTNTAKSVVFGIYSYSNGHPRTLLGSGSISSPIAGSWNTIPTNAIALTANATYYLTLLGLGGTIPYRDSGGTSETSLQTNLTNLPSTWSSGTSWATGNLSAYCSGNMGVTVSIAPTSVTVNQGTQQQFTATVTGTSNTAVVWSVKSGTGTVSVRDYTRLPPAETEHSVFVQYRLIPPRALRLWLPFLVQRS